MQQPMCPDKYLNRAWIGHVDNVIYLLGTIHPYITDSTPRRNIHIFVLRVMIIKLSIYP